MGKLYNKLFSWKAKKKDGADKNGHSLDVDSIAAAGKKSYVITAQKRDIVKLLLGLNMATLLLMVFAILFIIFYFQKQFKQKDNNLYVIKNDKVYHAFKESDDQRSIFEYENHIKTFLYNGFAYNKFNFEERIEMALELLDNNNGLAFYKGLQSSNTKNRLINMNCFTEVSIDSLAVSSTGKYPIGTVIFSQTTHYEDKKIPKYYKMEAAMRQVNRTPKNGFGIELFNIKYYDYDKALARN